MAIIANLSPISPPAVHYARLYGSLECYAVQTPAGTLVVDHDCHVYALDAEHLGALTRLGAVPAVERANVLAALQRCGEVR